jgi:hypothetical protein
MSNKINHRNQKSKFSDSVMCWCQLRLEGLIWLGQPPFSVYLLAFKVSKWTELWETNIGFCWDNNIGGLMQKYLLGDYNVVKNE